MRIIPEIFETESVNDDDFINLALSYGSPIKSRCDGGIIDVLVSAKSNEIKRDSLSKRYGLNAFPIHTDCAYLKIPPKYIFLRYNGSILNPTPTIVVNFDKSKLSEEELSFISEKMWFVRSKNIGFYSPIFKNGFIRYDKEVMKLANSNYDMMEQILVKMEKREIYWTYNKVVIINNHTNLHYRPQISQLEHNKRILQRINIL